jgi:hypothetical protein
LALSNCRDARCGLLNCKTENGNVAPCPLLSRWMLLLSVLRGYANLFASSGLT